MLSRRARRWACRAEVWAARLAVWARSRGSGECCGEREGWDWEREVRRLGEEEEEGRRRDVSCAELGRGVLAGQLAWGGDGGSTFYPGPPRGASARAVRAAEDPRVWVGGWFADRGAMTVLGAGCAVVGRRVWEYGLMRRVSGGEAGGWRSRWGSKVGEGMRCSLRWAWSLRWSSSGRFWGESVNGEVWRL